jgi:hypothetical protein
MCFAKETDEENRKKDILLRMHRFREGTDVWPAKCVVSVRKRSTWA